MGSPIKRILVTIAGGEPSIATAKYGICIAKILNSELFIQYVVNEKALEDLLRSKVFVKAESIEYERELEKQGNKYLENIKKLAEAKQVKVKTILSKGIVYEEVVKAVKELDIDILTMGELKEHVSRKDSFYDEGERMFRGAECSVLVVKGIQQAEEAYANL